MAVFLARANDTRDSADMVLRAALDHLWLVTIHPFDGGNGRNARAVADWALARSARSAQRFQSMSAQIRQERNEYYDILEQTQKGTLDVTPWMAWFLACLGRAIDGADVTLGAVLRKARFTPPRNHFLYKAHHWPLDDLAVDDDNTDFSQLYEPALDTDEPGFLLRLGFCTYLLFEQLMLDLAAASPVIAAQVGGSRCLTDPSVPELDRYRSFLATLEQAQAS